MSESKYRINQKGIHFYKENIEGHYCNLALQLLISHLIKKLPNPYNENNGWVSLKEAERITVNAYHILEKWREYGEIERQEIRNSKE